MIDPSSQWLAFLGDFAFRLSSDEIKEVVQGETVFRAQTDGEISDEEAEATAEKIAPVMERLGSGMSPKKVRRNARRISRDRERVDETIGIFNEVIPQEVLASIASQFLEAIEDDDEAAKVEQKFVDSIIERWQVEPGFRSRIGDSCSKPG